MPNTPVPAAATGLPTACLTSRSHKATTEAAANFGSFNNPLKTDDPKLDRPTMPKFGEFKIRDLTSSCGDIATTEMSRHDIPTRPVFPNFGTVPFLPNDVDVRRILGDEIDRLLYLLDLIDGDTDFEEGADLEPSLAGGSSFECDAELDTADGEPSLGAPETGDGDQTHWCQGAGEDLEADDSDREPSGGGYAENDDDALFPGLHGHLAAEAGICHRVRNFLDMETDAARAASARLGAIIARLSDTPCATASRL